VSDELLQKITALEERVAHAELGRDNALAMAEEARARSRLLRGSAGRRIAALLDLVNKLCQEAPGSRDWAQARVQDILGHAQGAEKQVE
jgi:hypothetical protein